MTINEMRMFVDAVRRQADEAFRKQMEESDERIEAGARARQAVHISRSRPRPVTAQGQGRRLAANGLR